MLNIRAKFKEAAATTDIQIDDKVKAKLARIGELERILNSPAPKPDMTGVGNFGFNPDQLTNDPRLAVSELATLLNEFGAL